MPLTGRWRTIGHLFIQRGDDSGFRATLFTGTGRRKRR
jgi:hypothetical protein